MKRFIFQLEPRKEAAQESRAKMLADLYDFDTVARADERVSSSLSAGAHRCSAFISFVSATMNGR
jgi:hypothetical protein